MPLSTRLFTDAKSHLIPYLAAIHANCVTSDSSIVTFLPPLDQDRLLRFWKDCIADVHAGRRLMVLLFDEPHSLLHHEHEQQSESPPHPRSAAGGEGPAVAPGNPGATSGKTIEGLHLMGVVTLYTPYSETGAFRGWVEKLLVSPKFRRRGGARALMGALEEEALRRGKTLLVSLFPPLSLVCLWSGEGDLGREMMREEADGER